MDAITIIDEEIPRARLGLLLRHVCELGDDREPWRVMFPLKEVLLLVTCATIASCDDFDDIVDWGEHHLDFLRRFSAFHHGIPCERWLRHLVNRVDPILFGRCFETWVAALWPDRHEFIAIDGKTARRTHDRRKGLKALHTLSAYAICARLTLAQLSVPEKTNEITAIPDLLDALAEAKQLEGALVSIDAMGCQVDIADKIVAHKADYLLPLKGNQPTLEADVEDYFRTAPADELVAKTTVEKGHGRIETRAYTASRNVDWIASERSYPGQPRFKSIATLVKVGCRTEHADRSTFDTRYFISSAPSTSNGSPGPPEAIGASKACIGCSMSSSRTTCRAIEPATVPKTWPSSAASPSASSAPTRTRAASRYAASAQAGARTSCSISSRSNDR
jgi:predicted transposase YbfD/YdcC